ncbi:MULTISPECIES: hypothetical protein [Streptomyces]|uniref:hypothetical protein n=1 Tax=Streptomyces nigra TaxID=1827580 RepID=UPI003673DEB1
MAAKEIGKVDSQMVRQVGGTCLAGPRGVIGSLKQGRGAAQFDYHVLYTLARAGYGLGVVLFMPGSQGLPAETAAQVVL